MNSAPRCLKSKPGCLLSFIFCVTASITDIAVSVFFSGLGLSLSEQMQSSSARILYLIVDHIFLFGLVFLICMLNRRSPHSLPLKSVLPREERRISIILRCQNRVLYYEISNPFPDGYDRQEKGRFHGYGLKNVRSCVERYGGAMEISKEGGVFCVHAHMNGM